MKLSAIVITKNEAKNIGNVLKSLSFTDEQLVIDSYSTDQTVKIAQKMGAKVFEQKWLGFGPQKNFGAQQALGEWLLFIDADEEVTPELQKEILELINSNKKDFYWLKIVTVFLNYPLKHLYGHNPRLFKKESGHWNQALVHEQVETLEGKKISLGDNNSLITQNYLLHHSHVTIESYLKKMHHYTTLDAEQMAKTKKHRSGRKVKKSLLLPFHLSIRQFIKLYFYRNGFKDLVPGLIWCVLSSYYEWEMARKFLKLTK